MKAHEINTLTTAHRRCDTSGTLCCQGRDTAINAACADDTRHASAESKRRNLFTTIVDSFVSVQLTIDQCSWHVRLNRPSWVCRLVESADWFTVSVLNWNDTNKSIYTTRCTVIITKTFYGQLLLTICKIIIVVVVMYMKEHWFLEHHGHGATDSWVVYFPLSCSL